MNSPTFISARRTAGSALLVLALFACLANAAPPNVIVINCDDLGFGDLGYYGARDLRTPQLDRMAAEGTLFTDFSGVAALCTAEALRFIEAEREQPFFLYLSHAMPHLPFDASAKFKGKSPRGLYGDVVEELDDSTGQILDRVRALGLAEKTLVIFTSDNEPERRTPGTAAPLRGSKHTAYEGGLRVPLLAWWPGKVPANRVCDDFLSTLDVLPTLAALAGAKVDHALDGFDVSAVLLGKDGAHSPRTTLYSPYGDKANRRESFRERRWKLHLSTPPELYDLRTDLAESNDVATQHPGIVQRLTGLAVKLREETRALPFLSAPTP